LAKVEEVQALEAKGRELEGQLEFIKEECTKLYEKYKDLLD
jgi:hypothetical protein